MLHAGSMTANVDRAQEAHWSFVPLRVVRLPARITRGPRPRAPRWPARRGSSKQSGRGARRRRPGSRPSTRLGGRVRPAETTASRAGVHRGGSVPAGSVGRRVAIRPVCRPQVGEERRRTRRAPLARRRPQRRGARTPRPCGSPRPAARARRAPSPCSRSPSRNLLPPRELLPRRHQPPRDAVHRLHRRTRPAHAGRTVGGRCFHLRRWGAMPTRPPRR